MSSLQRGEWPYRGVALAAGALISLGLVPAAASAASGWTPVVYHGERFEVPASWPLHDLASDPATCVRFDRHAVYEGQAAAAARCPARVLGVAGAVQVAPLDAVTRAQSGPGLRPATIGGQAALVNSDQAVSHRLVAVFPAAGVLATISYGGDAAVARRILDSFTPTGSGSPASAPAGPTSGSPASPPAGSTDTSPGGSTAAAPAGGSSTVVGGATPAAGTASADPTPTVGPTTYAGYGFDTCGAPSESQMAAWRAHSPYRAAGIYIGGVNRGCPDGNLSASWVADEAADGWRFIPLYVGLQAPCANQGGMASIDPSQAASEGSAAANDAAGDARYFGLGAGSPVYFDMEGWDTNDTSCSDAVETFVRAWSSQLGEDGFEPGIYGSSDSGIAQDIAPMYQSTSRPPLVDFAEWQTSADTDSQYIPASDWADEQRIKQYNGNLTQTWGGVTMSIDEDYAGGVVAGTTPPTVSGVSPSSGAVSSTVTVTGEGFFPGRTGVDFGGVASSSVSVSSAAALTARIPARAMGSADVTVTTPGGTSATSAADVFRYLPITAAATEKDGGYLLVSSAGNVYNFDAAFHGSPAGHPLPAPVVGIAVDPRTGGYWLATSRGNVYNFDAPFYGSTATRAIPAPVVAITSTATGYLLTTSRGNVYNFDTPFRGSTATRAIPAPVVAAAAIGNGYVLTTSRGNVYNFDTAFYGSMATKSIPAAVVSVSADPGAGGYWLATSRGNVYNFYAPFHGSTARQALVAPVSAVASTGTGYVLATQAGAVYAYSTAYHGSPATG